MRQTATPVTRLHPSHDNAPGDKFVPRRKFEPCAAAQDPMIVGAREAKARIVVAAKARIVEVPAAATPPRDQSIRGHQQSHQQSRPRSPDRRGGDNRGSPPAREHPDHWMLDHWKRIGSPIDLQKGGRGECFAWFPNWYSAIDDVCNLAEKEDWSKLVPDGSNPKPTGRLQDYFSYLWRFITTTYTSQVANDIMLLIFSRSGEGERAVRGGHAVFDTGLLTRNSKEAIYALFSRNKRVGRNDPPYVFTKW